MTFIRARELLFFFLLITTVCVRADVIVDNLDQPIDRYFGPIGDNANSNSFLIGQEFTLPASTNEYQMDEISLQLDPVNGGASITASIWGVGSSNNPSSEIAALVPQYINTTGPANFVFSNTVMLAAGTYYVVAAPTVPADSGYVFWAFATNGVWSGTGSLENYADTYNGVWDNFPIDPSVQDYPQEMCVVATPVLPTDIKLSRLTNYLKLTWTTTNGFVVEGATNLASPVWLAVTNVPKVTGITNYITNNWTAPVQFFRLHQQFAVSNLSETLSTTTGGPLGTNAGSKSYFIGQEFTLPAGNYKIDGVTLPLTPSSKAGVAASIWSPDPSNNPGTEIALIATQQISTAGNISFTPSAPITLSGGNYYLVATPATPGDNAKVKWHWTSLTNWTGFGVLAPIADTSQGQWQNYPMIDGPYQMSIQATPTP
jgi:hypothetical protein